MFDVVAIGESLIDFTPSGKNDKGIDLFARNPGGAPANVLAMCARLNRRTAFIGKVGRDGFGDFLRDTMETVGIDCTGLCYADEIPTTLAFVQLDDKGNRSFSFYRKPGADILLEWDEVDKSLLENCRIFHFGGVSLTDDPAATATLRAVEYAKAKGALISYDPNYRPLLWKSEAQAVAVMKDACRFADILKVSDEEITLLTGETDIGKGASALLDLGCSLVIVTLGPAGAQAYTGAGSILLPTFDVKTIDTTGAGDAFLGAVLHKLMGMTAGEIGGLTPERLEEIVTFGNAAGSLTTTAYGAIPAMPVEQDIVALING